MKSIAAILEELKITNPELYASLEQVIRQCAFGSGIVTENSSDTTEHPIDPPPHS